MSGLTHIFMPTVLYQLRLPEAARSILALALSFEETGLTASNDELMEKLGKGRATITNAITILEKAELVIIENRQSKYRKLKINRDLLTKNLVSSNPQLTKILAGRTDLLTKILGSTYQKPSNGTKGTEDNTNTGFCFVLRSGKSWQLPIGKLEEYRRAYSGIDIESELQKAGQWLIDNPAKRKTAGGMPKFLNGWLGRAKPQGDNGGLIPTREVTEAEADELLKGMTP